MYTAEFCVVDPDATGDRSLKATELDACLTNCWLTPGKRRHQFWQPLS